VELLTIAGEAAEKDAGTASSEGAISALLISS
jgi:hypothetical protein